MKQINEGLDYHDLEGQLEPTVSVDEYSAHMGKDSEIVTLAFTIRNRSAGTDLADWFERGYDWVLDAEVSEGELAPGKYIVFVEMSRRMTAAARIIELLDDLNTLSNIPLKEWTIIIGEEEYPAEQKVLAQVLTISPHEYREEEKEIELDSETSLNEMRKAAGIEVKKLYTNSDPALKAYKALAGL